MELSMRSALTTVLHRTFGRSAATYKRTAQRFSLPAESANGDWFAIVVGATALLIVAAVTIRSHGQARPTTVGQQFHSYALLLTDSVAAAGFGHSLSPMQFPTAGNPPRASNSLAVRLGARMADLSVLANARISSADAAYYQRDSSAIRFAAEQDRLAAGVAHYLAADAELLPQGWKAASFFRATAAEALRGGTLTSGNRENAARYILEFQPLHVIMGNWLECVRIAALRGDSGFFQNPRIESAAAYVARLADLTPSARAALLRIDWLLRNDPTTHFRRIARESAELLSTLGR
jgi:hypothetical protein